ncbi:unnamed protein product [Cunninghamella blakesleeana]
MTSPIEPFDVSNPQGLLRNQIFMLAHQSRSILARASRRHPRITREEPVSLSQMYSNGQLSCPYYLLNTTYHALIDEQYDLYCRKTLNKLSANSITTTNTTNNNKNNNTNNNDIYTPSTSTPSIHTRLLDNNNNNLDNYNNNNNINNNDKIKTNKRIKLSLDPHDSFSAKLITVDLRLPTTWNLLKDKHEYFELGFDGLELSYNESDKDDNEFEARSIRADQYIKSQCGIYYFEVKILANQSSDGDIGIGLCTILSRLEKLPGEEGSSWGYHGESGYIRSSSSTGYKDYGPTYGAGDTIGCGINFNDNSAFFTKNGVHLGTAFKDLGWKKLYPVIGFRTAGNTIQANFGQKEFMFDLVHYMKMESQQLVQSIFSKDYHFDFMDEDKDNDDQEDHDNKNDNNNNGFISSSSSTPAPTPSSTSSSSFIEKGKQPLPLQKKRKTMKKSDNDLSQDTGKWNKEKIRQDICKSLRYGDVDYVFNQCELHYPNILKKFPRILFRLRCQKFISMVKKIHFNQLDQSIPTDSPSTSTSSPSSKPSSRGKKRLHEDMEKESNGKEKSIIDDSQALNDLLDFGQFLYKEYGHINNNNNSNNNNNNEEKKKNIHYYYYYQQHHHHRYYKNDDNNNNNNNNNEDELEGIDVNHELVSTTSFLAYKNMNDNPISYLNGTKWREMMAYELNTAILVEEGIQPISALEKLYQQTTTTINELVLNGNGKVSLIPKLNHLL